jgi:hypothetical protein
MVHLVRCRQVYLSGKSGQPPEQYRDLTPTILSVLFETVYSRGVITGKLRVVVNQIIGCLRSLTLKVYSFKLFA